MKAAYVTILNHSSQNLKILHFHAMLSYNGLDSYYACSQHIIRVYLKHYQMTLLLTVKESHSKLARKPLRFAGVKKLASLPSCT